jgi:hypothetical protein
MTRFIRKVPGGRCDPFVLRYPEVDIRKNTFFQKVISFQREPGPVPAGQNTGYPLWTWGGGADSLYIDLPFYFSKKEELFMQKEKSYVMWFEDLGKDDGLHRGDNDINTG